MTNARVEALRQHHWHRMQPTIESIRYCNLLFGLRRLFMKTIQISQQTIKRCPGVYRRPWDLKRISSSAYWVSRIKFQSKRKWKSMSHKGGQYQEQEYQLEELQVLLLLLLEIHRNKPNQTQIHLRLRAEECQEVEALQWEEAWLVEDRDLLHLKTGLQHQHSLLLPNFQSQYK